jgi:hypothetical protein
MQPFTDASGICHGKDAARACLSFTCQQRLSAAAVTVVCWLRIQGKLLLLLVPLHVSNTTASCVHNLHSLTTEVSMCSCKKICKPLCSRWRCCSADQCRRCCPVLLHLPLLLQAGAVPPGVQVAPTVPGQYGQRPAPTHEYHQTQTIKNQVNLKKKTLRLEPLQDSVISNSSSSSKEFALRFAFDASAPCRVTTFLLATEDPKQGCKITAAAPGVRPAAYYPKGVSGARCDCQQCQQHVGFCIH